MAIARPTEEGGGIMLEALLERGEEEGGRPPGRRAAPVEESKWKPGPPASAQDDRAIGIR